MSFAITEKQQHRSPSGCAGIFFQLWQWPRRLAKKKLFSRKLLPPARRAIKSSEVFGIDDKMPTAKLLLIAEENRGGFPLAKKPEPNARPGRGTRAPGLVATLMGLDSMPVSVPERPDDATESPVPLGRKTCWKVDSRSSKLHRTREGLLERQMTEDGGAQPSPSGKNAPRMPCARNKHHKLASPPAKSPRLLAGRPRARLMQAATKILEPEMQSRNQAMCAIRYVESSVANDDANADAIATGKSDKSQELLDGSDSRKSQLLMHKKDKFCPGGSFNSNLSKITSSGVRSCTQTGVSLHNKQSESTERRHLVGNIQNLSKQRLHSESMNNLNRTQAAIVRDKVAFGSKECSRKPIVKDANELISHTSSVPIGRSLKNYTGTKSTYGVTDRQRVNTGRISSEKSLVHKRTISHNEKFSAVNSTLAKEESFKNCSTNRERIDFSGNQVMNKKCIRNEPRKKDSGDCSNYTGNDIASFTLSSPVNHSARPFSSEALKVRANASHELHHDASLKRSLMDINNNNMPLQRRTRSVVDEQSTVLEQNMGVVTSVGWNELRTRNTLSAASILQELIASLIAGYPTGQSDPTDTVSSSKTINSFSHNQDLFNFSIMPSQVLNVKKDPKKEARGSSGDFLHTKDNHSPISVFEASFSNDSCSYRSLDVSSEGKPPDATDSWSTSESSGMDPEILDTATSDVDIWKSGIKKFSHSDKSQPRIFVHSCEVEQPKYEYLATAQTVSNAGILLENFISPDFDGIKDVEFSLESFLRDTLEAVLDPIKLQRNCNYKEAKASHVFKQCLFDCMIQCLDSKYNFFCRSGYKNWSKVFHFLTTDQLRREVHEQIRELMNLSGKLSDELIVNEMNNSTERWSYYEDEAFETGKEIARDILETLVKEIYSF